MLKHLRVLGNVGQFSWLMFVLAGLLVVSGASRSMASIDVYEFSNQQNQEKYQRLTEQLRCPKCQNQDIKDSNAPIAKDMRREVHRLVEEGQSEESIVEFMVERFGEFVSYKPAVNAKTAALWYGPFVLILVGLLIIYIIVKKRSVTDTNTNSGETHVAESDVEKQARALLNEYEQKQKRK